MRGPDGSSAAGLTVAGRLSGLPFVKMTGSGNDFVFFDAAVVDRAIVTQPDAIRAICNRFNGIGADGLVLLEGRADGADARISYFNSDGTPADLCGNATLCSTAIAIELGFGRASGLALQTDAGLINSRIRDGLPEIDFPAPTDIRDTVAIERESGERRIGFAVAGVPHLVVLVDDVEAVNLAQRGAILRRHAETSAAGANVNFVSPGASGGWRYRTFERGVEGETLACGTGSVATALMLKLWGLSGSPVTLWTSSGRPLVVTFGAPSGDSSVLMPSLLGEGRVVYQGIIESLPVS